MAHTDKGYEVGKEEINGMGGEMLDHGGRRWLLRRIATIAIDPLLFAWFGGTAKVRPFCTPTFPLFYHSLMSCRHGCTE